MDTMTVGSDTACTEVPVAAFIDDSPGLNYNVLSSPWYLEEEDSPAAVEEDFEEPAEAPTPKEVTVALPDCDSKRVVSNGLNRPECRHQQQQQSTGTDDTEEQQEVFGSSSRRNPCTDQKFDEYRRQALNFLVCSNNTFVLEVYSVEEFILQVKISNKEATLSLNSPKPWSTVSGRTVSRQLFKEAVKKQDSVTDSILELRGGELSPSRIVRFVLDNSGGVPAIVSSNFINLLHKRGGARTSFLDHLVFDQLVPGSQRCHQDDCGKMASAVHMDISSSPKALYCAKHVRRLGLEDTVLLYNPLLVAITAHTHNVVISALDVREVYGPRMGCWTHIPRGRPVPLPRKWAPLCKKSQAKPLQATTPLGKIVETVKNVLVCAEEHLYQGSKHGIGVSSRHSLTCCILETFLEHSGKNELCRFCQDETPGSTPHLGTGQPIRQHSSCGCSMYIVSC